MPIMIWCLLKKIITVIKKIIPSKYMIDNLNYKENKSNATKSVNSKLATSLIIKFYNSKWWRIYYVFAIYKLYCS